MYNHADSFRQNAFPKCIHRQSRRNSSLSIPSRISINAIEPTTTPSDSSPETPNQPQEELSVASLKLRDIMRHVPHSVVALTAPIIRPGSEVSEGMAGMTLSSFNTVTLSPDPIITFNIKRPSRTLDALKATQDLKTIESIPDEKQRRFHIHLLEANDAGANIATRFSRGGLLSAKDLALLTRRAHNDYPFYYHTGALMKGVRRLLECEILHNGHGAFIDVGDHTLVFAKVTRISLKTKSKVLPEREWKGLCYMQGRYHTPVILTIEGKADMEVSKKGWRWRNMR
ncbi:hypothetical protein NHQ30_005307 [Ciborinia camelliae]|nr:hypothetical protein NHQ30_005307 [Ciborinia camelliae]